MVGKGLDTWMKNLPPSDNFELPESVHSLMSLLEKTGMERELANLKESYLKGVKPLTTYEELQRELDLLESGNLPFSKEEFSIRWKRSVKQSTFTVSFENLASMKLAQFELLTRNVRTDLFMRAVRTELMGFEDGDVKAIRSLCDELQAFAGKDQLWHVVAKEKEGFSASEMDSKICAGGDPMKLGPIVESLMPFVDAELFPKMNGRFETIIQRGKKKAKKKKEEEK